MSTGTRGNQRFNLHHSAELSDMARAKRNKPHTPAKAHDRRSRDLLRNAEGAPIEVDDPLALEPGEKIVTLRSIRNDPLARLHTHRLIDEAQYQGGRAFQDDWEKAERGPQPGAAGSASIPRANMSTAGGRGSRLRKASTRPCCG